jgi:hypothetical protein
MTTTAELDERLDQARLSYYDAIDQGKLDVADMAYAQLDALLEERLHAVQQRQP